MVENNILKKWLLKRLLKLISLNVKKTWVCHTCLQENLGLKRMKFDPVLCMFAVCKNANFKIELDHPS